MSDAILLRRRTPEVAVREAPEVVRRVARADRPRSLAALQEFVRFPTVSSDRRCSPHLKRCAAWLVRHLRGIGFGEVRVREFGGPPVVVARIRRPGAPRVLVYGHFDVVPSGGHRPWRHPPFAAVVTDGRLYGRGASDDKGPVWAHLSAVAAWTRAGGTLPVDVTVLLDGEEEIGSVHLPPALDEVRHADVVLVSDTRMRGADHPALVTSLRGSMVVDVEVSVPGRPVHSGAFGGAVVNPVQVLAGALAGLHGSDGKITVPGFGSSIVPLDPDMRRRIRASGPTDAELAQQAGRPISRGVPHLSAFERCTTQPAITATAVSAGDSGSAERNAIPTRARARLDVRLVVAQNPRQALTQIAAHLRSTIPTGIRMSVRAARSTPPAMVDTGHAAIDLVSTALRSVYQRDVALLPSGGTIPAVSMMHRQLTAPIVLMGFSLPDDNAHGHDESFELARLWRATDACVEVLQALQDLPSAGTQRSRIR